MIGFKSGSTDKLSICCDEEHIIMCYYVALLRNFKEELCRTYSVLLTCCFVDAILNLFFIIFTESVHYCCLKSTEMEPDVMVFLTHAPQL